MAKKKTKKTKKTTQTDTEQSASLSKTDSPSVSGLTFLQCATLIQEIEDMAQQNEGVLTDEQIETLVKVQTEEITKFKGLCNFLKLLENKVELCENRIKEIKESKDYAKNVYERISKRIAEFVNNEGKTYHVGEYTLKSRKSTSVDLIDDFKHPFYCNVEVQKIIKPDKKYIKKCLEKGELIDGATLNVDYHLTIK